MKDNPEKNIEEIQLEFSNAEKLYSEAQALKMVNMGLVVKAQKDTEKMKPADLLKHSQMALKAIETQFKILCEMQKERDENRDETSLEMVWEAFNCVPQVRAMISRKAIRGMEMIILEKTKPPMTATVSNSRVRPNTEMMKPNSAGMTLTWMGSMPMTSRASSSLATFMLPR